MLDLKGDHVSVNFCTVSLCYNSNFSTLMQIAVCSLPEGEGSPADLISSESYEWDAPANLDDFFGRIYR